MKNYIVFFGLLLISHQSVCSNDRLEGILTGYGQMIAAKEQELQILESQISDTLKKLDDIKLNNVDILEMDRIRNELIQKEELLRVCENSVKNEESSSAFWSTMKEIVKPKLEEKLKDFKTENLVTNVTTTWDTIKNNWKDIPRQIVIYFTEN
ncbi:uncharacterized protein [Drosophila suzukii]|uniref:Uncharacterized protein n=1 Tax=Drosophila suzukii TaxID=28584 RepID=A0AB39ZD54_DROSZ